MKIGFFLALRSNTSHFLHAASLVKEAHRWMPECEIVQLSDETTPMVPGAHAVERVEGDRPLLHQRLTQYASCEGEWLLIDTDVSIRADVREVFTDPVFDVALCDRNWPHLHHETQRLSLTMPFNTGVVFSRNATFWYDVLTLWLGLPVNVQNDWMSEQQAVYEVVRTGRYRVKILPGLSYNYPPKSEDDVPVSASLVHFKGPRKPWLSTHAIRMLGGVA